MHVFHKMMKGLHRFSIQEFAIYELTVAFWILVLVKAFPVVMTLDIWIYAAVAIVLTVVLFYRIGAKSE